MKLITDFSSSPVQNNRINQCYHKAAQTTIANSAANELRNCCSKRTQKLKITMYVRIGRINSKLEEKITKT